MSYQVPPINTDDESEYRSIAGLPDTIPDNSYFSVAPGPRGRAYTTTTGASLGMQNRLDPLTVRPGPQTGIPLGRYTEHQYSVHPPTEAFLLP